jgi:hypothetical protein
MILIDFAAVNSSKQTSLISDASCSFVVCFCGAVSSFQLISSVEKVFVSSLKFARIGILSVAFGRVQLQTGHRACDLIYILRFLTH